MSNSSSESESAADPKWSGRKIIVALSGGIACYKTAALVSQLVQCGAQPRVLMTKAATKFVGPLTLQSLSGQPVLSSIWQHDDHPESQHVGLAQWCDLMLIAPASAAIIAKLAAGLSGNLVTLTAIALPRSTPLLLAPAMNAEMWANPVVQRNLTTVKDLLGAHTVGPDDGWQACRTAGPGRMSEPDAIRETAAALIARQ